MPMAMVGTAVAVVVATVASEVAALAVLAAVCARVRLALMAAARRSRPGLPWAWRGRLSRLTGGGTR